MEKLVDDKWLNEMETLLRDEARWNLIKEEENAKVFSRPEDGSSLSAIRVELISSSSVDSLMNLLDENMIQKHHEWNPTFIGGKVLAEPAKGIQIQLWKYKVPFPLKNRDFVIIRRVVRNDDGSALIAEKSIDSDLMPIQPDFVRCTLKYNVRLFEPIKIGVTKMLYMNHTDINGWVPSFICNKANPSISLEEMKAISKITS